MSRKVMRQVLQLSAFVALVLLSMAARAGTLAYEGFDYPNAGSPALLGLNGGSGWGGAWAAGASALNGGFTVSQDDASLSSTAFPFTPLGDRNLAAGPGSGSNTNQITRLLPSQFDLGADGVLYASLLFRKETNGGASSDNMEFNLIPASGESTGGAPIRLGSTSGDLFFLNVATNTAGTVTLGETYFLVLKVAASAAGSDVASAMIFDSSETVSTVEPVTWDSTNSFTSTAVLDRVRLWIGAVTAGQFDEIRIGNTWESVAVIPEPASLALLAIAGIGLAVAPPRRAVRG